jgi:Lar family restriction alleviation protein
MIGNEFKPCPFCGSKLIEPIDGECRTFMMCNNCGACGPKIENQLHEGDELAAAADAWNKRDN